MTKEIQSRPLTGAVGLVLLFVLLALSVLMVLPSTPVEPLGLRIALVAIWG